VNPARGIGLKVLSVAIFMTMSVCIKLASTHVPPGEIVFFRSFFAIPVILVWLWSAHHLHDGLRTRHPLGHLWRGLLGASAMACSFTALGLLPLPEVTAIGYASPVLVTIFAAIFLHEAVRFYRVGAVFLGLVGVIIVLAPSLSAVDQATPWQTVGALTALMSAVFGALAQITVRNLLATETTTCIVFYFSLSASVLALFTIPFGWVWPTPEEAALLVGAGILGGFGQIALTESYRHAETAVIAPFEYTSMLLAIAAGYFLFAEAPTLATLAGAALVVLAGLIIIWRERQLGLERGKARQSMTPQG
jgi:drug/metabolite transporter (DMT)-like permease